VRRVVPSDCMYLSRLYIKNYRSIKELDLVLSKGKTVIVGKNNAGKSNIIRALDLVLGESSPTFVRSDNVTENDFYSWKETNEREATIRSADKISIWCELQREPNESLNYEDLYKCYGFYVYSEIVRWENNKPIKQPDRIFKEDLPHNFGAIFGPTEDSSEKEYVNPKLKHQKTFEQQFDDKFSFAFAFHAIRDDEGIVSKDIRFLFREDATKDWILAFKAPIRCELLQSAIIPSFRDPQNQLRASNWTWYGKLMQHLTSGHLRSTELLNALDQVRAVADKIFS
jgi:putative ATP-dependent endonuclease of the OLD family